MKRTREEIKAIDNQLGMSGLSEISKQRLLKRRNRLIQKQWKYRVN